MSKDFDIYIDKKDNDLVTKLFCTFTLKDDLDNILQTIRSKYTILYNKIFVLSTEEEELICTYNLDPVNTDESRPLKNTILAHRKKDFNVIFTINSINALARKLNKNDDFQVEWNDHRNSILLTRDGEFHKLNTKIFDIIYLN